MSQILKSFTQTTQYINVRSHQFNIVELDAVNEVPSGVSSFEQAGFYYLSCAGGRLFRDSVSDQIQASSACLYATFRQRCQDRPHDRQCAWVNPSVMGYCIRHAIICIPRLFLISRQDQRAYIRWANDHSISAGKTPIQGRHLPSFTHYSTALSIITGGKGLVFGLQQAGTTHTYSPSVKNPKLLFQGQSFCLSRIFFRAKLETPLARSHRE